MPATNSVPSCQHTKMGLISTHVGSETTNNNSKNNSEFHIFELHLPSASWGAILIGSCILAALILHWLWKRRRSQKEKKRRTYHDQIQQQGGHLASAALQSPKCCCTTTPGTAPTPPPTPSIGETVANKLQQMEQSLHKLELKASTRGCPSNIFS